MTARVLVAALSVVCLALPLYSQEPLRLSTAMAVEQAMIHNEAVLIAGSQTIGAQHRLREVRADGLPTLSAGVNYTRNWLLPTFVFADRTVKIGTDNDMTGLLTLRQPLYTGGRVSGSQQRAAQEAIASAASQRRARQQVAADVEIAIYDYLLAAEILDVNRVALARARSNLQQVTALRRVGQTSEFDLTRARVQVSTAAADSVARENEFALVAIALLDLVGLPLDQEVIIEATFRQTTSLAVDDLDGLIAIAHERRPESSQLWSLRQAQDGAVRVARAGGRPNLDFVANGRIQFQNDALGAIDTGDEWRRSWSTGLVMNLPLFDGRRSRAQVAQAQQQARQLQLQQSRLLRAIEREVRQAWMDLHEANGRLRARQGSVVEAQKGLQDAGLRYRTGTGRQLEVLDAQLALVEAETESARARRDRASALVTLELATGALWVPGFEEEGQG